ncbi:MAG TPA: response regulator [Candidatus Omnitrophota bacterium]|nr:response regulator [Candidatus Omnitrophota bacterium]
MSRILIVEDTRLMRESLVDVLAAAGHEVTTADNGVQACETVAAGAVFDVIITDIIMPEMDGIQAILELQTLQPGARIIAISGGSARMEKAQGLETAKRLGAVAVLEKPFEVDALLSAVDAALG